MLPIFGKPVVIEIPFEPPDSQESSNEYPILRISSLEEEHPEGLAGHPEIQSLQQWLDLQG